MKTPVRDFVPADNLIPAEGFVLLKEQPLAKSAALTKGISLPGGLALALIRFYQLAVSPYLPRSCRYTPSCSAYAYEAVQKYGAARGVIMAVKRILRCHPFHPGGFDPVP